MLCTELSSHSLSIVILFENSRGKVTRLLLYSICQVTPFLGHQYTPLLEVPKPALSISCYNNTPVNTIKQLLYQELIIGVSLSKPQYSQEWYVRHVHETLLNKNGLPHTIAECVRTSCLQKYTERIPTLLLKGMYVANTKVY